MIGENQISYLLLFANILVVLSLIPLAYESTIMKYTSNIPYTTLIGFSAAFLIFMVSTALKKYWFNVFIYFVGFIVVMYMIVSKKEFDEYHTKKKVIIYEEKKN